jgi:hypothetical protein
MIRHVAAASAALRAALAFSPPPARAQQVAADEIRAIARDATARPPGSEPLPPAAGAPAASSAAITRALRQGRCTWDDWFYRASALYGTACPA